MQGVRFVPASVTVSVGDSVTWTNQDGIAHSARADNGSFDTGLFTTGSRSVSFGQAGTFGYFCAVHPSTMRGTVTVMGAATPPPATARPTPPPTVRPSPPPPTLIPSTLTATAPPPSATPTAAAPPPGPPRRGGPRPVAPPRPRRPGPHRSRPPRARRPVRRRPPLDRHCRVKGP